MDRRQFRQFIDAACCYKRSVVYVCVTDTAYADRIDADPGVSLSVCPSERTDRQQTDALGLPLRGEVASTVNP